MLEGALEDEHPHVRRAARTALAAIEGVSSCEQTGTRLSVESDRDVRAAAAAAVIEHGGELVELRSENRTLEDIYLRYFQQD